MPSRFPTRCRALGCQLSRSCHQPARSVQASVLPTGELIRSSISAGCQRPLPHSSAPAAHPGPRRARDSPLSWRPPQPFPRSRRHRAVTQPAARAVRDPQGSGWATPPALHNGGAARAAPQPSAGRCVTPAERPGAWRQFPGARHEPRYIRRSPRRPALASAKYTPRTPGRRSGVRRLLYADSPSGELPGNGGCGQRGKKYCKTRASTWSAMFQPSAEPPRPGRAARPGAHCSPRRAVPFPPRSRSTASFNFHPSPSGPTERSLSGALPSSAGETFPKLFISN